jgi:acetylornithine deacetylase
MKETSVLETLASLVRINSINPVYENGNPEAEIADYIERFFAARGVETWRQDVFPERPNVIARLPGRKPGRRLVLEAHMDTASITGMTIPAFDPVVRQGRLYGRGSCDTKAGLAAMMHAVASLHETGTTPECEVWMVAAADEEHSFRGVLKLCENIEAQGAIVAEPTELKAIVASKGVLRWKVSTEGKAAHSSKPHLGVNAIVHMARVVDEFEKASAGLRERVHPLLGPATLNIGVIRGGVQVNFVPDRCEIEIDRRLLPGEKADEVLAGYQVLLDRLCDSDPSMRLSVEPPWISDEAMETPPESRVARTAVEVLREMGMPDSLVGVPFGSDASKLSRCGVPSIIFGPGSIDRAHAAVEYVECDQVVQAEAFYRKFLTSFN